MRFVKATGVACLLAAVAAPLVAQSETDLCLRVQAAAGLDLADAQAVQDGIGSGEILVTEVVPCGEVTAPSASASPVAEVGTGAWVVGPIEIDPMTDERSALVSLDAESGTTWYGRAFTLTIACTDGSTELFVSWFSDLGPDRLIDVVTRIGGGETTTDRWFNDGQITSYGGADTAFVESLFGETRLAHQVQKYEAGLATAVFDISGIENAVANVRETCGW